MTRRMALLLGLMITLAPAARAHVESGGAGSLLSGLLHPVTGLDHVVAMVAVGLWGAVLAAPAICRPHRPARLTNVNQATAIVRKSALPSIKFRN